MDHSSHNPHNIPKDVYCLVIKIILCLPSNEFGHNLHFESCLKMDFKLKNYVNPNEW